MLNTLNVYSFITNAFMIEHILPKLPIDPFMMWHLYQINHVWCKVVNPLNGIPLSIVKHYVFYHHTRDFKAVFETTFAI
jgi:hypothetical protein